MNENTQKELSKAPKWTVVKSDSDRRLVFGWANIAVHVDGEPVVDWQ